jgi:uncharacterized protein (TIGR02145 family)
MVFTPEPYPQGFLVAFRITPLALCHKKVYIFTRIVLMVGLGLALSATDVSGSCDIKDYRIVKIGEQIWMAENLNCDVTGSLCYDNNPANCAKYGRLYNWAVAMELPSSCNSVACQNRVASKHKGICPAGWHIPSDAEFVALVTAVGGSSTVGKKLKTASGWNDYNGNSGNGTDEYGFSVLPSGYGYSSGYFLGAGDYGFWWSTSEYNGNFAHYRYLYYNLDGALWFNYDKSTLFSVRCVRD